MIENKVEDFKLIPLTQGKFAIVDADDYEWLSQYKWCAARSRETFYAQNQYNKRPKEDCSSRYKGVIRRRDCKRWRARIGFKRKRIRLGDFADEIKAAIAYDDKAIELFGEFAYLNFPERIELRNWIRKIVRAA